MPKIKFSKSKIDSIKFASKGEQVIYWDIDNPGLGLVVGKKVKTFRLQIDIKDPSKSKGYRTVKKTLGRFGTELTFEQAKDIVSGYVDAATGQMVIGERLKIKAESPEKNIVVVGAGITVKELVGLYYRNTKRKDGLERKDQTAIQYTKLVERHYEGWMDMKLGEVAAITPDIVLDKYRTNEIDFGKATTRNSSSVLSSILNYARATYPVALSNNPLAILSNPYVNVRAARKARHECLIYDPTKKRNDFPLYLTGIQKCRLTVRDGFLFALFTGMRRNEVETLKWVHIDIQHKELFIEDTKNRQDLHIPLNNQAMEVLERRMTDATSDFIFPQARSGGKNRTGHIQLNSKTLKEQTGLDLTVHGLRRTFENVGRNKIKRYEDTSKLTNHVDSSIEGRHYDEAVIADLRETSQMIGDAIERYIFEKERI